MIESDANITYNWQIICYESVMFKGEFYKLMNHISSKSHFNDTFVKEGSCLIKLTASNSISSVTLEQTYDNSLLVSTPISDISLFSYNEFSSGSASKVGVAQFLFILMEGTDYSCQIDYGDGSKAQIMVSLVYNYNGTYLQNTYLRQG